MKFILAFVVAAFAALPDSFAGEAPVTGPYGPIPTGLYWISPGDDCFPIVFIDYSESGAHVSLMNENGKIIFMENDETAGPESSELTIYRGLVHVTKAFIGIEISNPNTSPSHTCHYVK